MERVRSAGIASTVPVNCGKAAGHGRYGALVQWGKCTWYFPVSPIVWKIPPALPRSHTECSAAQREAFLRSEFAISVGSIPQMSHCLVQRFPSTAAGPIQFSLQGRHRNLPNQTGLGSRAQACTPRVSQWVSCISDFRNCTIGAHRNRVVAPVYCRPAREFALFRLHPVDHGHESGCPSSTCIKSDDTIRSTSFGEYKCRTGREVVGQWLACHSNVGLPKELSTMHTPGNYCTRRQLIAHFKTLRKDTVEIPLIFRCITQGNLDVWKREFMGTRQEALKFNVARKWLLRLLSLTKHDVTMPGSCRSMKAT